MTLSNSLFSFLRLTLLRIFNLAITRQDSNAIFYWHMRHLHETFFRYHRLVLIWFFWLDGMRSKFIKKFDFCLLATRLDSDFFVKPKWSHYTDAAASMMLHTSGMIFSTAQLFLSLIRPFTKVWVWKMTSKTFLVYSYRLCISITLNQSPVSQVGVLSCATEPAIVITGIVFQSYCVWIINYLAT